MATLAGMVCVEKNSTYQHLQGVLLLRLNSIASELKLTNTEYRLMGVLIGLYNKKQQKAFPSLNYMAQVAGISRSTIIRTLKSLTDKNLLVIVKTAGKKNSYYFSRLMLNETATSSHNDTPTRVTCATSHDHELKENKTNRTNIITKQKDDDSSKTQSISDYKQIINKLESWRVSGSKKILSRHGIQKVKDLIKVVEERKPDNAGAYFRSLLNISGENMSEQNMSSKTASEQTQIECMVKHKYWQHIPTGKIAQVLPDVGEHLLIKYHKAENMVTFFDIALTDSLNNFQTIS